jgi:hypothetical protein
MSILFQKQPQLNSVDITLLKEDILAEFNARIKSWYENVKDEYGVVGEGVGKFLGDSFLVYYKEDGKRFLAKMAIHDEYLIENKIDWVFNVWAELSMEITELDPLSLIHSYTTKN